MVDPRVIMKKRGEVIMATKSILKDIDIKDKESAKALIVALEKAEKKKKKNIEVSRTYSDADNADILLSTLGES